MKIWILILTLSAHMYASEISIIGAGLSGLASAYRLQQNGHQVTVYEALDRAGGRVFTYYSGNSYEELGGKFLNDGGDALHIRNLIQELGLEVDTREIPLIKNYIFQGESISFDSLLETLPPPNEENYQQLQKIASSSRHLGDIFDQFFKEHPLARQCIENRTKNYEGSESDHLSVKYLDLFWEFYRRQHEYVSLQKQGLHPTYTVPTVKGGNSCLVNALCERINNIEYEIPLKKIRREPNGKLLLFFENGEEKFTDYLILTVPLPLLKEIDFGELLNDERKKIFDNLPYGFNSKIIIPVCPSSHIDLQFAYTDHGVTWLNADQTLLTVYCGGESAQYSSDASSIQEIYRRELPILKTHYPQIIFPSEEKVIGMGWPKEPYFQGSYSNFGIDLFDELNEVIEIHDIPVRKTYSPLHGRVFFAGEATAIEFTGTMEGAVESAERISALVNKVAAGAISR